MSDNEITSHISEEEGDSEIDVYKRKEQLEAEIKNDNEQLEELSKETDDKINEVMGDPDGPSVLVDPNSIFVKGVDYKVTPDKLNEVFSRYGPIELTTILCTKSGHPKGYAYIRFKNPESATKALLYNGQLEGRQLEVSRKRKNIPKFQLLKVRGRGGYRGRGAHRGRGGYTRDHGRYGASFSPY